MNWADSSLDSLFVDYWHEGLLLNPRILSRALLKTTDISSYSQYLPNYNFGWEEHEALPKILELMEVKQIWQIETIQDIYIHNYYLSKTAV